MLKSYQRAQIVRWSKEYHAQEITDIWPTFWSSMGVKRDTEDRINFLIKILYKYYRGYEREV